MIFERCLNSSAAVASRSATNLATYSRNLATNPSQDNSAAAVKFDEGDEKRNILRGMVFHFNFESTLVFGESEKKIQNGICCTHCITFSTEVEFVHLC